MPHWTNSGKRDIIWKFTINKKSTIFFQFCSNFQRLIYPWVDQSLKVWAKSDKNCGFFINGEFSDTISFYLNLFCVPQQKRFLTVHRVELIVFWRRFQRPKTNLHNFLYLHFRSITPPTPWTKSGPLFKNWLPMFGKLPTNPIVTNCWLFAKNTKIRNYLKLPKFPNLPVLPWKCWKMENSKQKLAKK